MEGRMGVTRTIIPRRGAGTRALRVAAVLAALGGTVAPASGQSLLLRPPDMSGTWVGEPGTLYFHFLHRFEASPAPARKVTNYPTFLLAAALPANLLVGAHYATNSALVPGYPNEWELFGRFLPVSQERGAPLDLSFTAARNQPAHSWDGELAAARQIGPLRLLAAGRGFSDFRRTGDTRWAAAGGATLRLHRFVAVAADVSTLLDREEGEKVGWGAGVQLGIPYSPHTLSLQVSTTNTTTLQGASAGLASRRHWGFEFTIPLTVARYASAFAPSPAPSPDDAAADSAEAAAEVTMTNQLRFEPAAVTIKVGQTVRWRNASALAHTVTADPSLAQQPEYVSLPEGAKPFNSGDIAPGATFSHTFTVPGEYRYFCIPHAPAGMVGRVIVEP